MVEIRELTAAEGYHHLDALASVLCDCVAGGASVSFMAPFSQADGASFFTKVLNDVERGDRTLFAAFSGSELVGTVQVVTAMPPNQPHRADVAKLLVPRSARGQGVATLLMHGVEAWAKSNGRTLLVLDTCAGSTAERLYLRLGWVRVGVIPRYALYPDGSWCDTTIFWKEVA